MKRTPLPRTTPLRPGKPLARGPGPKRRSRLRPTRKQRPATVARRKARAIQRHRDRFAGPWWPELDYNHAEAIRSLPCLLAGERGHRCDGSVEAAHVVRRTRGGRWSDLAPMCLALHLEYDTKLGNAPARFFERYGLSLESITATLVDRAVRDNGGLPA